MERYDVAVVGSGPAGLEAAINLKIRGKSFLLFGTPALSEKLEKAPRIQNYLGLGSVTGVELQRRFQEHIAEMEIEILHEQIQIVYPMGNYFTLASSKATYEATAVVLSPGTFSAKLLQGEEAFLGRGVGYCATCDAPLYRGKTVAVIGSSDEAAAETDFIATLAGKTYYLPAGRVGRMPAGPVEVLDGHAVGVAGDTVVRSLLLEDREIPVDGVFILRDMLAPSSLLPGIGMKDGFIAVNADMETSIPGCFAAGDCTGRPHQYMRAAGQGQTAALNAVSYIDKLHTSK